MSTLVTVIIQIVVVGFSNYFSNHVFNLWQKVLKNNDKVLEKIEAKEH
ncbi:hypothetical protein ACIGC1_17095 [Peribacillus butanolivorans]